MTHIPEPPRGPDGQYIPSALALRNFAAHPEVFGMTPAAPVRDTPQPPAISSAPQPPTYEYVGGTPQLDQLLAMEDDLYTKAKAIKDQLDEVKDRIKMELTAVSIAPGRPYERYRIAIPGAVVRVLKWKTSRRLDTKALRAEQPGIYQTYSKESGAWELSREGKA